MVGRLRTHDGTEFMMIDNRKDCHVVVTFVEADIFRPPDIAPAKRLPRRRCWNERWAAHLSRGRLGQQVTGCPCVRHPERRLHTRLDLGKLF